MRRLVACVVAVAVLGSCDWFPWLAEGGSYKRVMLWSRPDLTSLGEPGVDANAMYALGLNRVLHAVDRRSGASRWSAPSRQTGLIQGVAPIGEVVGAAAGGLAAFDASTGTFLWQNNDQPDRLGEYYFAHNDRAIFPSTLSSTTGSVYALDANGQTLWQTSIIPLDSTMGPDDRVRAFSPEYRDGAVVYSFVWWQGSGQPIPKGGVAVVDATTGRLRWSRMLPVASAAVNSFPSDAVTDGFGAFVSVRDGRVFGFSLADGSPLWVAGPVTPPSQPNATDIRPLTVLDRTVVVGSGRSVLTGYDSRTGGIKWHESSEDGGTAKLYRFGSFATIAIHYTGALTLRRTRDGRRLWFKQTRQGAGGATAIEVVGDTVFAVSPVDGLFAFRLVKE